MVQQIHQVWYIYHSFTLKRNTEIRSHPCDQPKLSKYSKEKQMHCMVNYVRSNLFRLIFFSSGFKLDPVWSFHKTLDPGIQLSYFFNSFWRDSTMQPQFRTTWLYSNNLANYNIDVLFLLPALVNCLNVMPLTYNTMFVNQGYESEPSINFYTNTNPEFYLWKFWFSRARTVIYNLFHLMEHMN